MIRAAALSYAIVFALLVGLIGSGILFISSTQKRIEITHTQSERLLFDSYSAIQIAKNELVGNDSTIYDHQNGNTSLLKSKIWGAFTLITSKTQHVDRKKERVAFLGSQLEEKLSCLYLPGRSGSLKICGETRLEGKVYSPNKRVERAYIGGKNYKYDKLVFGEILEAEEYLPPLKSEIKNLTLESFTKGLFKNDFLAKDSSYSFFQPTQFYTSIESVRIESDISGNVIIHSFDSIIVSKEAKLKSVLLISPIVFFESGFIGEVQVLAHEHITLEKNVKLNYPSALVLNELESKNDNLSRTIFIDEDSQVIGGILLTSQKKDFRKPPFLQLMNNSIVGGLVYVQGATNPQGKIIGSLFTESIRLKLGGSIYSNHLLDALISYDKLPKDFLYPNWFNTSTKSELKVIQWL
jgi:hypothetical protein